MKIGLVLSKTPGYSETFFLSKIKGLQANGFEVTLYVQEKASDFKWCTVVVAPKVYKKNKFFQFTVTFQVVFKLLTYLKSLHKFITLEKEINRSWKQTLKNIYNNAHILTADLEWLHFGFATMALQSEHVAKAIDAKMAVSLRGFDMAIYPLKHPRCYDLLWRQVDKVHTISNDLLSLAYQLGMYKDTSYAKITPAIEIKKFKTTVTDVNPIYHKSRINFLTIARLHWKKGLDDTLESLAILKTKGVKFRYTIIGTGDALEELVFAVYQLNLQEEVCFVGKKTHGDVIKYLSEADIYLQYSISEGFCNAVLEAQAMGCLCVVSDAEGLEENVNDGTTGWIVPKRNPQELTKTIMEVISFSEDFKLQIRINAQRRVAHEFYLEKQQKEFVDFYK